METPNFLVATLAFAVLAPAQIPLGTSTNMGATSTTRGNAPTPEHNPATLFVRLDKESYGGFTSGLVPGTVEVSGVNMVIQDQNLASQEAFNMVLYSGNPANNDYPDVANPVAVSGNFTLPLGPAGVAAYEGSIAFATPVTLPATLDVYVGIQFAAGWTYGANGPINGLSVWEIRDTAPVSPSASQSWDLAGARQPSQFPGRSPGGYYCSQPLAGPGYPVASQYFLQPVVQMSGGVATTRTTQTNHPESTAGATAGFLVQDPGAGTACMFSGLYPDAASPPRTAGRVDEIGQLFYNPGLNAGSPVFFLMDFGPLPASQIPAASFVPGSTGVGCLNFGTQVALGFGFLGTNGRAFRMSSFPAAARTMLAGIQWAQQAVALDTGSNTLHATACTVQRT